MSAKSSPAKPSSKSTKNAPKKVARKNAKKTAKTAAKRDTKKVAKKVAKKAAKTAAKKSAKKVAKKPIKKDTKKIAKKATKRPQTARLQAAALPAESRHKMIQVAAYFRAERRNFRHGDPMADWLSSEKEIDELLHHAAERR
jgi:hypothetical protein